VNPEFRAGERAVTPRLICTECGKAAQGNASWTDGSGEICDACVEASESTHFTPVPNLMGPASKRTATCGATTSIGSTLGFVSGSSNLAHVTCPDCPRAVVPWSPRFEGATAA